MLTVFLKKFSQIKILSNVLTALGSSSVIFQFLEGQIVAFQFLGSPSYPKGLTSLWYKNSSPGPKNKNFQKMKKTPPRFTV